MTTISYLPADIIGEIAARIPKGSWQPFVMTCKAFNQWNTREAIIKRANHLWTIYKMFPRADWSAHYLYVNPNTTLEILEEFLPRHWWDMDMVNMNPNISLNYIENKSKYDIEWNDWARSTKIAPIEIMKHCHYWANVITSNPNLTLEFICDNINKAWNFDRLSRFKGLTLEFIENHINEDWNWVILPMHPAITFDFMKKYSCKPWKWNMFSYNPNVTIEIVKANPKINWKWRDDRGLSYNIKLTLKIVKKYKNKLNFDSLSRNKTITIDIVKKYSKKRWNWAHLSNSIPLADILNNLDMSWKWVVISARPDVTQSLIKTRPELPWDIKGISKNPNLTFFDVIENPDRDWNFEEISANKFGRV